MALSKVVLMELFCYVIRRKQGVIKATISLLYPYLLQTKQRRKIIFKIIKNIVDNSNNLVYYK